MPSQDAYDAAYYSRSSPPSRFVESGDKPLLYRFWLRYLAKRMRSGLLLDVGCGVGHFLRRARKRYTCIGVDVSNYAVRRAIRVSGRPAVQGDSVALPFRDNSFDIVTAFDVLEHVLRPARVLSELARVAQYGGLIIISTPNPDSLGHKWKKARWFAFRDPTHVSILDSREWRGMIETQGLLVEAHGTDTLWDIPYFETVPVILQKILFLCVNNLLLLVRGFYPWKAGENLIYVLRRPAPADQTCRASVLSGKAQQGS